MSSSGYLNKINKISLKTDSKNMHTSIHYIHYITNEKTMKAKK